MEKWKQADEKIRQGKIGVIPTDTLYGIVGSALNPAAVQRIYQIRERDAHKPLIVLIGQLTDLEKLGIQPTEHQQAFIQRYWPGPYSFILNCAQPGFEYLHRGTATLAVRFPAAPELQSFLKEVGPIVAPSANLQGQPPAETVDQARRYFGDEADFYVDGGRLAGEPSALVDLAGGEIRVLRGNLEK